MEKLRSYSPAADELIRWWEAARRESGGPAPTRSQFSPGRVRGALPCTVLLEFGDDDALCVRLMGTQLDRWMGSALPPGTNIYSLIPDPGDVETTAYYYNSIRRFPCAGRVERHGYRKTGHSFTYTSIHLPLMANDGDAVRFLIGIGGVTDAPKLTTPLSRHPETNHSEWRFRSFQFFDLGYGAADDWYF